jgi:hypothetical protein
MGSSVDGLGVDAGGRFCFAGVSLSDGTSGSESGGRQFTRRPSSRAGGCLDLSNLAGFERSNERIEHLVGTVFEALKDASQNGLRISEGLAHLTETRRPRRGESVEVGKRAIEIIVCGLFDGDITERTAEDPKGPSGRHGQQRRRENINRVFAIHVGAYMPSFECARV